MRNDFCSNYLEHSAKGTTWKKGTSYLKRVWKNGKWIYEYSITGKGYKRDAEDAKRKSKEHSDFAKDVKKESKKLYGSNKSYNGAKTMERIYNNNTKKAESYGRAAASAESNYKTKSLAGNIERGTQKIAGILKRLKSSTTETIKDTFTGETRTPNRSGETINVKQAAEKNKKVVSDDGKTKVTVSSNISPKKKKKKK